MTKRNSTKRALIASVLSLALCFTMLVGSTFAWFTDSATTGVNQIVSGNLEIVLVDENGNEITEALKWKVSDGKTQADILWEPGCTYELQEVFVKNKGNLAVTFAVSVTGIEASDAKLNEVIDWTVTLPDSGLLPAGETSDAVDIVAHMQETAGNDYMNQTIDGVKVAVYATQVSYENDSYGDDYDSLAATYIEAFGDTTAIEITPETAAAAFANFEDGAVFKLAAGTYTTLPGHLVGRSVALIADGEVKFEGSKEFANGHNGENSGSTLYIEGIDFSGALTVRDIGANVVIKDCSMNHIQLYGSDKNATAFVIDGCSIDGTTHTTGTLYGIYGTGIADDTVTITNNTIKNTTKHAIGINGTCGEVTITGNTFDNFGTDGDNRSAFHTWNNDKYSNGTTPAVGDTLPEISTALADAIKADNTFVNWKSTNAYASFGNVRFAD